MKIRARQKKNYYAWIRLLLLGALVQSQALALPNYNASGAELNAFQSFAVAQDPTLKGTQILVDDKTDVLYVSPSSKKAQSGSFQLLAAPACETLEHNYNLTYLMPDVPVKEYVNFAKNGPFSPFFDSKLGNYVRSSSLLHQILKKAAAIEALKGEHPEVIASYEKAKFNFENAQSAFNKAEAAYLELDKKVAMLSQLLMNAETQEEREKIKTLLLEAKEIRADEAKERKTILASAQKEVYAQQALYADAKELYDRTFPRLENLNADLAALTTIFETIDSLSAKNFAANEQKLQEFEATGVGIASASYSIWDDEEARLQNVVSAFSQNNPFYREFSVARLPIHNIRMKKPVSSFIAGKISGDFNGTTSIMAASKGTSADSLLIGDETSGADYPIFIKNGQMVSPQILTLSGDGAGTYNNVVSRGAFCTGKTGRESRTINTVIDSDSLRISSNFEVPFYAPRRSNMLSQSVALEYDFFTRSEPTNVSCTLNMSKFRSFISKVGESGFLFWRTSWTDVQRKRMDTSGISCNVEISPFGENPDFLQQKKYVADIQQAMMQEIAAEFILNYAKTWEITQRQSSLPDNSKSAYHAGVALMTLCGPNVYCAVGAIVLKTGKELFGAGSDTVSNQDQLSGTIERSYSESSWTTSNGQAIIDLSVSL